MEDLNIEEISTGKAEARFPWWVVLFVVIATGFGLYYLIVGMWPDMTAKPTIVEDEQSLVRRAIDGMPAEEGTSPSFPLAVMIENSVDAWPVSGINSANLVWEAPAEAGIPRFLAVFGDGEDVSKIGPVRSARPYYVSWAEEFHALYAHVGGSPEALSIIPSRDVFDLNEFWNGSYFTRFSARRAPHNVYTSSELWGKIGHGFSGTDFTDWWSWATDNSELVTGTASTSSIVVNFLAPNYIVEWEYNSSTQKYERWQAGAEHRDADGTLITADTVIVQHVKTKVIDEIGRISMETIGSGVVEVYFDGQKISGAWKKTDRTSRTMFFNEAGIEVKLKAGNIWVEIIYR